jgi:hypothetical protein
MTAVIQGVDVTSPSGTGRSTFNFGDLPIIFLLEPNHGFAGTLVTISGENFINAGVTSVTFGGVPATSFSIINDRTIAAIAPPAPQSGFHFFPVVVSTPTVTSPINLPFTYDVVFATWDSATASFVGLSADRLTATNIPNGDGGVCGVNPQSGGKYYFEITIVGISNATNASGGIGVTTTPADYGGLNSVGSGGVMNFVTGVVWANGSHSDPGTGHGYVGTQLQDGDIIGVAVNVDAGLVWFRCVSGPDVETVWNAGGFNNSPNANPLTGIDGFPIPGSGIIPFASFSSDPSTGDRYIANFGQKAYIINPAQVLGFEDWPGS